MRRKREIKGGRGKEERERCGRTMSHFSNNVHEAALCCNYGCHIDVTHWCQQHQSRLRIHMFCFVFLMCGKVSFIAIYLEKQETGSKMFSGYHKISMSTKCIFHKTQCYLIRLFGSSYTTYSFSPLSSIITPPLLTLVSFFLHFHPFSPPYPLWVRSNHKASGPN